MNPILKRFLFPRLTAAYAIRVACVAIAAWLFASKICIPARINGDSMLPTYHTGQWLLCWTPAYWHGYPKIGDIVMIAYSGHSVMLLKRVVALQGDTVEFKDGKLIVNGKEPDEPWAHATPSDWTAPEITVRTGCVYVVGDNRQMPAAEHPHGEVALEDIVGTPLWN